VSGVAVGKCWVAQALVRKVTRRMEMVPPAVVAEDPRAARMERMANVITVVSVREDEFVIGEEVVQKDL